MASVPVSSDIIVIGKKDPKPTLVPTLIIEVSNGGIRNGVTDYFAGLFRSRSKVEIDPAFSVKYQRFIREVLKRVKNDPDLAAAYQAMEAKNVIIYIHPVTRSDQIIEAQGGTYGKNNDGTISDGASLTIYIAQDISGAPPTDRQFVTIVLHEIIHALGVKAFDDKLDAPNSRWDIAKFADLFRDYNFDSAGPTDPTAPIIGDATTSGALSGTSSGSVYVGSLSGNTFTPVGGSNLIYTQDGSNTIQLSIGGNLDLVVNGGGATYIALPADTSVSNVAIVTIPTNDTIAVLVNNRPEIVIEQENISSSSITIVASGQSVPIQQISSRASLLRSSYSIQITKKGSFYGGFVGSAAISNLGGTRPLYRLGGITGDFLDQPWFVDAETGQITAQFSKQDVNTSQFTFLTIIVSDGSASSSISVTVRWAYSQETTPHL